MKTTGTETKKMYFGFEYADGVHTTSGEPNKGFEKFNGRLSIAGGAKVFNSISDRNEWLDGRCDSYGGRIAVNRAELRRMCAGMENESYREYMEYLTYQIV